MTHSHRFLSKIRRHSQRPNPTRRLMEGVCVVMLAAVTDGCHSETTFDSLSCYSITDSQPECLSRAQYQSELNQSDYDDCDDQVTVLSDAIERPAVQADPDAGPISGSNPPLECCHVIRTKRNKLCIGTGRPLIVERLARVAALQHHRDWIG